MVMIIYLNIMVVWYVSVGNECKEMKSLITIECFFDIFTRATGCPVQESIFLEKQFVQKYGAWSPFHVLAGDLCFVLTDLNSSENQEKSFLLKVLVWMEYHHDITSIDKNCVPSPFTTVHAILEVFISDHQMVKPSKKRQIAHDMLFKKEPSASRRRFLIWVFLILLGMNIWFLESSS